MDQAQDRLQEQVDDAAAQLLIELAFLVPKGTDLREHPVSRKLEAFKQAIEERAALRREARQEMNESRSPDGDGQGAASCVTANRHAPAGSTPAGSHTSREAQPSRCTCGDNFANPEPVDCPIHERREARGGQPSSGAQMITAERQRQVTAEGWSPAHDDTHCDAELVAAALCYASCAGLNAPRC